jgi:hypothetical protein
MNKRNILTLASMMAILLVPAAFSGAQADQQAAEPDYMATEFVWLPTNHVPDYMATEFLWLPTQHDVVASK